MAKRVKCPTYKAPLGWTEPLRRMTYDKPMALVKLNGEWLELAVPAQETLRVAEKWYLGGYVNDITDEEAADLPPQYVEDLL